MTPSEQIRPSPGAWPSRPCSLRRIPLRVRKPGPSPLRSLYSARISGPVSRSGAAHAPSGVSCCCSSPRAHRALITNLSLSLRQTCCRLNYSPAIARHRLARYSALRRRRPLGPVEIADEPAIGERSRHAQRSGDRPAVPGSLQAVLAGVQVRTPTRPARPGIDDDLAVNRHDAKQFRLGRSRPAPDACPDHRSGHARRNRPHSRLRLAYRAGASAAPGTCGARASPSPPEPRLVPPPGTPCPPARSLA
jgi:hypothetical protein